MLMKNATLLTIGFAAGVAWSLYKTAGFAGRHKKVREALACELVDWVSTKLFI